MSSKRSRAWSRRKAAALAADALVGKELPPWTEVGTSDPLPSALAAARLAVPFKREVGLPETWAEWEMKKGGG